MYYVSEEQYNQGITTKQVTILIHIHVTRYSLKRTVCISSPLASSTSTSGNCKGRSSTMRCCKPEVDSYGCDGCGSDGMCNYCFSGDVTEDKTDCSGRGGGGGGGYNPYGASEGGLIAGAIVSSLVIIGIAVGAGVMLSNKAKKAAEDANQPVESLCCCCGRSWATSASVVALSSVILILVICLCNTFIGLLLTASDSSRNLGDAKFIWLDLPVIFTVAASLASIAAYRLACASA